MFAYIYLILFFKYNFFKYLKIIQIYVFYNLGVNKRLRLIEIGEKYRSVKLVALETTSINITLCKMKYFNILKNTLIYFGGQTKTFQKYW